VEAAHKQVSGDLNVYDGNEPHPEEWSEASRRDGGRLDGLGELEQVPSQLGSVGLLDVVAAGWEDDARARRAH
jgi:hypothetical protein